MKKIISALLVFVLFLSMSMPIIASGKYIWPLIGYTTITSNFGYRNDPFTGEWKGHSGTDIGAPYGTPVYASSSGKLTIGYSGCTHNYSGQCGCGYTYGNFVYIDDDYGMRVYYAHLTSITASAGRVEQGQQIGTVGSTGNSTGSHLHFEMRTGTASSTRVDPLNYVNSSNQIGSPDTEAPTNVKVSTSGTDVTVSWSASANATSYDVYLIQSPWGWSDIKYSKSTTSTSHKFTGVTPGTYKAFVVARPNDNTAQSKWVEFTVAPLPSAPTNISVYAYGADVTIAWSASANATSYKCYIVKAEQGNPQACTPVETTSTSCKVSLEQGKTYYAYVVAKNSSGSSNSSEWYLFGTVAKPAVNSVEVSGKTATVSWSQTIYASSYKCYVVKATAGNPQACTPIETTNTNCTFTLDHGQTYYAYVVAIGSCGNSTSDWQIFGTTGKAAITEVKQDGSNVSVTWNNANYAQYYDVYLIQSPWNWSDVKYSHSTSGTSYTFTNVKNGEYAAFVIARPSPDNDQSLWSYFTVNAEAPSAPVIKTDIAYTNTDSIVTVTWDAVSNATSYTYYLAEYPEGYAYTTNEKTGTITNNQITFSNLTSGKYTMFVHANNSAGQSPQSNPLTFEIYSREYIPSKTIEYNGHIYAIYDYEMSWTFARDLCDYLGGHLVTITSEEENLAVNSLLESGQKNSYWIGAYNTDESSESFEWITKESMEYSNWYINEPNLSGDKGEKELYAEIRKTYNNQWNDVKNTSKTDKGFIIEIEPDDKYITHTETFCGNKYLLIDKNTTWLDAKLYCEMLGGHLITINSDDEQEFIDDFIKQGNRSWYYMGASGSDSKWTWIDGTDGQNIKWKGDGACAYDGYLMKYKTDDYISLNNSYYPASHICYIGFVCEIPVKDIETIVTKNNDLYTINVDTYNIQSSYDIIVSGYKNNELISCTTAIDNVAILSGDINRIKVMVWDSLSSLKPLCDEEVITSSQFITR